MSTPYSYRQYAGNGSTTTFSVPFPYLLKAHVKVYLGFNLLDGTFSSELADGVGFNWTSATQIQLTSAPTTGQTVTVIRQTPSSTLTVDWQDGSNLVADDLRTADLQNLYVVQEQEDKSNLAIKTANDAAIELNDLTTYGENYLGAFAQDPAAKPNGGVIQEGNLYYNTTTNRFRVYGESAWSDGAAPTTLFRWKKTAAGGETSLSGNDDNAQALTYVADFEQVYRNGALLVRGVDYVAINGATITGLTALTAGDVVEVISFNAFTIGVAPTSVDFTGLPAANQPVDDSDLFLLRQGTTNKKITASVFRTELATNAEAAQAGAEAAKTGAETAQAGAEAAKTGAEAAKTGAETARTGAETARDDALLNAGVYPAIANGLAATAVGGYFKTYSGSTDAFLDLYRADAGPVATLVSTYPSRSFFSFLDIDSVYDEYYSAVWVDSANRLSMAVKPNGVVRIEKGEIGSLSVTSITAPGGSIDLDSVDTPLVNFTNTASVGGDAAFSEFYSAVTVDNSDRIAFAIEADGSTRVSKLNVNGQGRLSEEDDYSHTYAYAITDSSNRICFGVRNSGAIDIRLSDFYSFSGAHGTSGLYTVVSDAYQKPQIVVGGQNGVLTLTSEGGNWNPVITAESPERVLFQSDRTSGVRYWVMNSDGTRQAPATPSKNDITFWGDSMTQRLQSYAHLPALLPGRTITYNALGGTSIEHIIARQGGENATCTIPSGSIPASGSVALRNVWPSLGYHAGTLTVVGATYSYLVTIAGVQGTLTSTTNASSQADYTFTRTYAGSAVSVTGSVEIIVLSNITQGSFGFSKQNTGVFWMGTNPLSSLPSSTYDPNIGTGVYYKSPATTYDPTNSAAVQARTEAITQALLNRVENLDRHVLIVGPFIGQGQVWASSSEKQAIVAGFSTFSKHWYDLRSDFIATCKTWLQSNYPAVYPNWAQTDDDHVANGAAPPILREDGIHLNTYGSDLVSELIAARLTSMNW